MGTLSIDAQQSAQITKLQEDVEELTTKLNAAVTDITELRNKIVSNRGLINDIRADLIEVQDVLNKDGSGTYTLSSGGSTDGVLKKIYNIEQAIGMYLDYGLSYNTSTLVTELGINPSSASVPGTNPPGSMSTISTAAATDPASQTSSAATPTGTYTTSSTNVVTIETDAASRAREVATSTLTKLRDL